jgi:hypothetical protein
LSWLLPLAGNLDNLFGLQGWFDQRAYADAARLQAQAEAGQLNEGVILPISWSALYWVSGNPAALTAVYWASVGVVVLFTLGVATRLTAVLTWLVVATFTSNPALYYQGDVLVRILAFYLMVGYVLLGQRDRRASLVSRLLGSTSTGLLGWQRDGSDPVRPSLAANLVLRLMQVHFAIVIIVSGLHKLQSGNWWGGVALWFPLYPPYETTLAEARAQAPHATSYLFVLSAATYAVLVWQIGFPLFAWRPRWRVVLLGGAVIGWLGTALIYRLPLIGPAYLIGCLSFVTADEWHTLFGLLSRLPGLNWLRRWGHADQEAETTWPGVRKDSAAAPVKPELRLAKTEPMVFRAPGS